MLISNVINISKLDTYPPQNNKQRIKKQKNKTESIHVDHRQKNAKKQNKKSNVYKKKEGIFSFSFCFFTFCQNKIK